MNAMDKLVLAVLALAVLAYVFRPFKRKSWLTAADERSIQNALHWHRSGGKVIFGGERADLRQAEFDRRLEQIEEEASEAEGLRMTMAEFLGTTNFEQDAFKACLFTRKPDPTDASEIDASAYNTQASAGNTRHDDLKARQFADRLNKAALQARAKTLLDEANRLHIALGDILQRLIREVPARLFDLDKLLPHERACAEHALVVVWRNPAQGLDQFCNIEAWRYALLGEGYHPGEGLDTAQMGGAALKWPEIDASSLDKPQPSEVERAYREGYTDAKEHIGETVDEAWPLSDSWYRVQTNATQSQAVEQRVGFIDLPVREMREEPKPAQVDQFAQETDLAYEAVCLFVSPTYWFDPSLPIERNQAPDLDVPSPAALDAKAEYMANLRSAAEDERHAGADDLWDIKAWRSPSMETLLEQLDADIADFKTKKAEARMQEQTKVINRLMQSDPAMVEGSTVHVPPAVAAKYVAPARTPFACLKESPIVGHCPQWCGQETCRVTEAAADSAGWVNNMEAETKAMKESFIRSGRPGEPVDETFVSWPLGTRTYRTDPPLPLGPTGKAALENVQYTREAGGLCSQNEQNVEKATESRVQSESVSGIGQCQRQRCRCFSVGKCSVPSYAPAADEGSLA